MLKANATKKSSKRVIKQNEIATCTHDACTEYIVRIFKPNEFIEPEMNEGYRYYSDIKSSVSIRYKKI